jgi:hypothetical protein
MIVTNRTLLVVALLVLTGFGGCGKSSEQLERERLAREAAVQHAIAESQAEEREKDRRMRESAAAEANERIARQDRERDQGLARAAAADAVAAQAEQQRAADADLLRRYTDKLKQSVPDPASVEVRYAALSPKRNGMCGWFNAKDKAGRIAGLKRVVVTDARVTTEEQPTTRDAMTQFLLFQLAARDTGCFPDVQQVKIMQ